jgi:transposase
MTNYKEIARLKRKGESNRSIGKLLSLSRNKVNRIVQAMVNSEDSLSSYEMMNEKDIAQKINSNQRRRIEDFEFPDYEKLKKELSKPGVTMQLLWEEYQDECRLSRRQAYRLTQFKKYFREYLSKSGFTDILQHRAGEKTEIDWAGTKPRWHDPYTGEVVYGWLFVGVLPYSGYGFAKAFPDMKMNSWIQGHIDMFEYFGGVSKILVPDNLKTAITKNKKDEVIINRTYNDLVNHYGAVVIPARVRKPKDKSRVEGMVNQLTTNIIARMRNYHFFRIDEYNERLRIELNEVNGKPFQKKEGSRSILFHEIEKACLIPLPKYAYRMCLRKKAKVSSNSHVSTGKCYYSVPYKYIGEEVELNVFEDDLEIYHNHEKLCTHTVIKGKVGQYSTDSLHMPPNSNAFGEWNSTRYLNWAKQKGKYVHQVILKHFERTNVEQQKYKTVHNILKLADNYGNSRLELACQYALELNGCPSYQNLKMILINKQEVLAKKIDKTTKVSQSKYLRGSKYYE